MGVDTEQLHARAGEFALTHVLDSDQWLDGAFWPEFTTAMERLRSFARNLIDHRAKCSQPAEDWLLDHMAFLETQEQEVRRTFTKFALRQLPCHENTKIPRIMAIGEDYLQSVGDHYDSASFEDYVIAYQEVSVLSLLECWTLPGALRVVLIRRLTKVMEEVQYRYQVCRSVTSTLTDALSGDLSRGRTEAVLNGHTHHEGLNATQIVHILQHLNELDSNAEPIRDWLAIHVEASDVSLSHMIEYEHQLQAEFQVATGTLVQSLHLLEQMPWEASFKRISHVEKILASGPESDYIRLDEASQDALRRRVAILARQMKVPETLLAHTVVRLAQQQGSATRVAQTADEATRDDNEIIHTRQQCSAYYLLDAGGEIALRRELSRLVHPRHLWALTVRRHPWVAYLSTGTLVFVLLVMLKGLLVSYGMTKQWMDWIGMGLVLALPVSEWVVNIVHSGITRSLRPEILLRYDFSDGVPPEATTMVVVPVIWSTKEEVDNAVHRLLVHYLANRQDNLYFAILADYKDAHGPVQPDDEKLVSYAVKRIDHLRDTYGRARFFLFHRERRHNPVDRVHMGWERKRGKLVEFVEFLGGKSDTSYTVKDGDMSVLPRVRYLFTVDEDTELPIGVVSRMAGTIHLPYNRPRLNATGTRVVEGYGVLEPRIGVSVESAQKSRFSALWAGEPGIDPYAFAVSDPYQNLFGSAMFVGKGIFDVESFHKTLVKTIPDNRVLSHDYLEGGFLRTGLTSDIEVIEEHPDTYYAYQRRLHRWIRGDWQLITWLWPRVKNREGARIWPDLPALTRWQIFDTLRRSLVTPWLFVLSVLSLTVLPGRASAWQLIVVLTLFLPFLRSAVQLATEHGTLSAVRTGLLQSVIKFVTLPFDTILTADAMVRTLYRVFISRRRLLEWITSSQTNNHSGRQMFVYEPIGYLLIVAYAAIVWSHPTGLGRVVGFMMAFVWLLSHPIMWWLTQEARPVSRAWVEPVRSQLQRWAQEIWSFYADYVTAEESWLPPDNVQLRPKMAVAHRTSPTNIGLYLASVVSAKDLGFIDLHTMLDKLENTLNTADKMEKWKGHLLNWYDTRTVAALPPRYVSTVDSGNLVSYLMVVRQALMELEHAGEDEESRRVSPLLTLISKLISETDFSALYDADEHVFCLGYHADMDRLETVRYDLLASEARQASFVAIALGKIPVSHWFRLGRTMTIAEGHKTLLSWSGTMFEYLMPSLIMRTFPMTVWASTYQGVIQRQYSYALCRGVPFGISESGYYAFDYQLNYQYRAFGVPGLGFERGLEQNLVVAPYAAMLALPFAADLALDSLRELERIGAKGQYGFYEAVDFTKGRLPKDHPYEVIQSFMAHHQGMSLLALTNLLRDDVMIHRFHRDPNVQATRLLLQERVPVRPALVQRTLGIHATVPELEGHVDDAERTFTELPKVPEVSVLSNGRLTSISSTNGGGRLTWNGISISRWRSDPVVPSPGVTLYVRDVSSEATWTVPWFPRSGSSDARTVYRLDRLTHEERVDGILSTLDVTVSPDTDAEIRRLKLVNEGNTDRTLEVSSFLELALAPQAADVAHAAFVRLFVETEHDASMQCLLARRRPREETDEELWAVHGMYLNGTEAGDYEYETDRAVFIGRGYSLAEPAAMPERLRGTTGAVADPAFIMHRTLRLRAHASATVYIVTGIAPSRTQALEIARNMREPALADRQFHLAWMRSQIDLRHLHLSPGQASSAQMLAGRLMYTPPLSEERTRAILANTLGQHALWSHAISGDIPVVTVRIQSTAELPFVTLLARQHQYLVSLGIASDLLVWDETPGGYQDEVMHRLRDNLAARGISELRSIVALKASQLSGEVQNLFKAVSSVWIDAGGPSLWTQLNPEGKRTENRENEREEVGRIPATPSVHPHAPAAPFGEFFNGWGGFVQDGTAYEIRVRHGEYLPRPWSNVMANAAFGSLVTELGTGYSWWKNARECKLTPWSNDPVLDPPGEVLYLRDLATNDVWSATPSPCGGDRAYKVTHAFGTTTFDQTSGHVTHTLRMTVPQDAPLKVMEIELYNQSAEKKRMAITYYAEWVLGVSRESETPYIVSEWDSTSSTLLARNKYQETFRDAIAFLHLEQDGGESQSKQPDALSWTADRAQFLLGPSETEQGDARHDGLNERRIHHRPQHLGSRAEPLELYEDRLSGQVGAFADSCGAVQMVVELPPHSRKKVRILLGCTDAVDTVHQLVTGYGSGTAYAKIASETRDFWTGVTTRVQVQTPDRAMDVLLNGWLLYQALASRLWARTGFSQAGGAYGFRDQLQDALAFLHTDPMITRRQILLHAGHQYREGDAQHWWHEETGRGIRTRYSDDLLWLPYAVSRYVEQTGDTNLLFEVVPFLESPVLREDELERYEEIVVSPDARSVLGHCLRAIRHALHVGPHGLPLIGTGDWNDGLNAIGKRGQGESVWLGWFLLDVLHRFERLGELLLQGDFDNGAVGRTFHRSPGLPSDVTAELLTDAVAEFSERAGELETAINREAWDGAWFRRAFTDDGQVLGSIENKECRIDAIAQSFAIISGGTSRERQLRAMRSFDRELVDRELNLVKLLTRPFDETNPSPGYIQGYPPGIRENGGQYTHGAIWSIIAWAMLGEGDKAYELFHMLNPISHTLTPHDVVTYGNEPYVMSADVYTASPHPGRAGWSWYTGAAGWMYQAGLEYILGVRRRADRLYICPATPLHWESYQVDYQYLRTTYIITVVCAEKEEHSEESRWVLDGENRGGAYLHLVDDGGTHQVTFYTGSIVNTPEACL